KCAEAPCASAIGIVVQKRRNRRRFTISPRSKCNAMNARYGAVRRRRRTVVNLRTPLRMSLVALVIAALLAVPALALELETAQSVRSTQGVVTAAHPLAAAAGA